MEMSNNERQWFVICILVLFAVAAMFIIHLEQDLNTKRYNSLVRRMDHHRELLHRPWGK